MKNRRYFILILFSFLLSACGQQGPLFMPVEVEQEPIENSTMEHTPIEIENRTAALKTMFVDSRQS
jgi:predicted small lipoprotein YifL